MTREEIRNHIRNYMEMRAEKKVMRKEQAARHETGIRRIRRTTLRRYAKR